MGRKELQAEEGMGSLLRRARNGKNVNLTTFAEQIGYTKAYLSRIETGKLNPPEELVLRYEKALSLEVGYFKNARTPSEETISVREGAPRDAYSQFKDNYNLNDITERISSSKKRIHILDNWLYKEPEAYKAAFQEALPTAGSVDVRIILLSPISECARLRSQDLDEYEFKSINDSSSRSGVPHTIMNNLLALQAWKQEEQFSKIDVRVHSRLPSVLLYIIDDEATLGLYLHKTPSRHGPHLQINLREMSMMKDYIMHEFHYMWHQGVPLEDCPLDEWRAQIETE